MSLLRRVYGILFVAGSEGVNKKNLADSLAVSSQEIEAELQNLKLKLQSDADSPLELVLYGDNYRLLTASDLETDLEKFAQNPLQQKLTRPAIETLAIVAYRQPITRMVVDEIRGVSSAAMLQKLVARDLIKEVGRVEAPGRPVLYGVTTYFLDYFGIQSLDQLPPIEELALNTQTVTEELYALKEWKIELYDQEQTSGP